MLGGGSLDVRLRAFLPGRLLNMQSENVGLETMVQIGGCSGSGRH